MTQVLSDWFSGLLRNPLYKVLSVLLAVAAWLYVQGDSVVEAKVRARVDWERPQGLLPTEPLPGTVTLTVGGPLNATRRAQRQDVRVTVDVTDIAAGEHRLDFDSFPVAGLPANVDVHGITPESVRFTLDEVAARKVEVEPVLVGEPAADSMVAAVKVTPPVVTIRGPRVRVEEVEQLRTLPIDVSDVEGDLEQRVELDLPRSVQLVTEDNIRVLVDVEPRFVTRTLPQIPVMVWGDSEWSAEPDRVSVTLRGGVGALDAVGPADLSVIAHLPDNRAGTVYEATWGPSEGLRLRVWLEPGSAVEVVGVDPQPVRLVRR